MNDKIKIVNDLHRVAGFLDALVSEGSEEPYFAYLREAVDFINNQPSHEEFKAAWLNIVNAIHSIDPEWLEKYQGESEWQKACDFIAEQNQELEKAQTIIYGLNHRYIGIDFAVSVSDNIHRQIVKDGLFKKGQHINPLFMAPTHSAPVFFLDLLRSVAITQIKEELAAAEKKHPTWPTDTVHASAILNEEAGKLTQAAIDFHYHSGSLEKVRSEAARVGAMAIRVLINLPYAKPAETRKTDAGCQDVNAGWHQRL